MTYDGLVMNGVARECHELLSGGRVDRIAQPNKNEIILHIYNQGRNHKLLISALAQEARVHLTSAAPPNPGHPPVFCMVLRKHLEGGRVLSVAQQGLDRILHISISAMDELGDFREKLLIAEIMGKHSNLILVDPESGRILDSMKRITEAVSRWRQVLPGEVYVPPPPSHKLPPWQEREETLSGRLLQAGASQALDKIILSTYDGLGPLSVQELIHRAGASPVDTLEYFGQGDYIRLYRALSALGADIAQGSYHPEILALAGRPKDFSAIALTLYPAGQRQAFGTANDMLDAFFRGRTTANLFRQRQSDLEQIIRREQERCRKKAGLQAESILEGKEARKWQVLGQLLMAEHYRLRQGPEATVTDIYDPEGGSVTIPMDPRLSPVENAQVYFKRYQKAKLTAEKAQIYYDDTMGELSYLDSVALSLTTVSTLEELSEVREELTQAGYLRRGGGAPTRERGAGRPASKLKGAQKAKKSRGGKAAAGDGGSAGSAGSALGRLRAGGFEILYGRNNRQNDYLNMKVAKAGDLWFHAQNIPSAHVVVRNPEKKDVPAEVIEAAAKICLWHSQAKASGRAPIDYTLRQNIWKPKGAKPGMMLYESYQTIFVSADEEDMARLIGS
ncbi:MAG: NFACT family protein [Clostridiales bacterium]|nr:NFACT family protein [Clostridiales bacterium]